MKFEYVHPDNLYPVWEYVRDGLLIIKTKSPEIWIPEDIYWQLKQGVSALYMAIHKDVEGFAILQPNNGWGGKEVNVFCAYSRNPQVVEFCLDEIKKIAKGIGAKRLVFESKRAGWEKRALELGYVKLHTRYGLELGD